MIAPIPPQHNNPSVYSGLLAVPTTHETQTYPIQSLCRKRFVSRAVCSTVCGAAGTQKQKWKVRE